MTSMRDQALDALLHPFAESLLRWPQAGDALFLRAREGAALHAIGARGFACTQPFKPEADGPNILDTTLVDGRNLLQRTGEFLKKLAGEDVWARWTANYVANLWAKMSESEAHDCDIVFGSLRFDCEAEALFKVAETTGKEVQIIFCDFHSDSYELNDHVSEKFAQYFIGLGCKDGDDITQLVKEKING